MIWLDEFKIAVANANLEQLERLVGNFPLEFENLEQMSEIQTLTQTAIDIVKNDIDKLNLEMKKLKDARRYVC